MSSCLKSVLLATVFGIALNFSSIVPSYAEGPQSRQVLAPDSSTSRNLQNADYSAGVPTFEAVYFAEGRQGFGDHFPLSVQKNHYVGTLIPINDDDQNGWFISYSVNGKSKSIQKKVKINDVFPTVENYLAISVGQRVRYFSDRGLKPQNYLGTVQRIFSNGIAEVNFDTGKKFRGNPDYVPVSRLNNVAAWRGSSASSSFQSAPGVTLRLSDSHKYLAAFSQERGLKKAPIEYLLELDRVVLERGNVLCQKEGFKGLVAEPRTQAFTPDPTFENSSARLFHPWRFTDNGGLKRMAFGLAAVSVAAGVGGGIGVGAAFALGATTVGLTALGSLPVCWPAAVGAGLGAAQGACLLGGHVVEKTTHFKISAEHALERNEKGKVVHKRYDKFKSKVPHLIFSEVICGDDPEAIIRFEGTSPKSEPEQQPIGSEYPLPPYHAW